MSPQDQRFHSRASTFLKCNPPCEDQIWSSTEMLRDCASRTSRKLPTACPLSGAHRLPARCRRQLADDPEALQELVLQIIQKLFGRLPKRTGWHLCSPENDIRACS